MFDGVTYDLSHLHPLCLNFIQPAKGVDLEKSYAVSVTFSLHCFTEKHNPNLIGLNYASKKEIRSFSFQRYQLSLQLPSIIQKLASNKCLHSGKGNFFVIQIVDNNGVKQNYEVYFEVNKSKTEKMSLDLIVQSAYIRDKNHNNVPKNKPIGFFVILNNRLTGKVIKIQ